MLWGREGKKEGAQVNCTVTSEKKLNVGISRNEESLNCWSRFCLCNQRVNTASSVVRILLLNFEALLNSKMRTVLGLTSSYLIIPGLGMTV